MQKDLQFPYMVKRFAKFNGLGFCYMQNWLLPTAFANFSSSLQPLRNLLPFTQD